MLGVGQGRVEDLDDLVAAQLPGVVVDQDRAGDRAGLVLVDPQDAHQLALDRLAELALAVEDRVLQAEPAGPVELDLPARHDRSWREYRTTPSRFRATGRDARIDSTVRPATRLMPRHVRWPACPLVAA